MGALIVSRSAHQTRTWLMVVRFRLRSVSKEDGREMCRTLAMR